MSPNPAPAPMPVATGRAAIHISGMPVSEALILCARRANALDCRVVAVTLDGYQICDPTASLINRLAEDEFDLIILRAGVRLPTTRSGAAGTEEG